MKDLKKLATFNNKFTKKQTIFVKSFKDGGLATTPYIPNGKMHRHEHRINSGKLGLELTKKGIPVLSESCETGKCELIQTAEIEAAEIIFPKAMVDQMEPLIEKYNKDKDVKILLELGNLVKKFLKTTEDTTGKFDTLIKKIK